MDKIIQLTEKELFLKLINERVMSLLLTKANVLAKFANSEKCVAGYRMAIEDIKTALKYIQV